MSPEELKEITEALNNADNSETIYVITSVLIVLIPVLLWAGKIIFKKTLSQVVKESVEPQIDVVKDLIEVRKKENEQMFKIMEMHIDELRRVKFEQNEIKERVSRLEGATKDPAGRDTF